MLTETFPEKNISLELARTAPFTYFGPQWHILKRAPNMRVFIDMTIDNIDLYSDELRIRSTCLKGECCDLTTI